jgi:two-component system, response regulator PdtaR
MPDTHHQSYDHYIKALMDISQAVTSDLFLEDVFKLIVMVVAKVTGVDICSLWLVDENSSPPKIRLKATQAIEPEYVIDRSLNLDEGVVGYVVSTQAPLVIPDVLQCEIFKEKEMARKLGLVSMVGVPLQGKKEKVIGVLNCFTSVPHEFSKTDINLLTTVANQAAVAILNTELIINTKIIEEELKARKKIERAKEIIFAKSNDVLGTTNRGNPAESSLCTLCRADCMGKCETWLSSLVGTQTAVPARFRHCHRRRQQHHPCGVSYNSLRIQGYAYGAHGMAQSDQRSGRLHFPQCRPDHRIRQEIKTKSPHSADDRRPGVDLHRRQILGLLCRRRRPGRHSDRGRRERGRRGPESEIADGKIKEAPELDRRIDTYLRYHDGYGAIIVQLNVEDTRNGVAEYVVEKYGDKCCIELKWGQGPRTSAARSRSRSIDYALFLKNRGYLVDPDPELPEVQEGLQKGRSNPSPATAAWAAPTSIPERVREDFMKSVDYLRKIGFKRISLKTGSYGMEELAMAIKFASEPDSTC